MCACDMKGKLSKPFDTKICDSHDCYTKLNKRNLNQLRTFSSRKPFLEKELKLPSKLQIITQSSER